MTSRHPTYSRYLETVEHKTVLGVSSHIVSVKKKKSLQEVSLKTREGLVIYI